MSTEEKEHFRQLREAYDAAFASWIAQANRTNAGSPADPERVKAAVQEYRRSRNKFAEVVLRNYAEPGQRSEVEQLAYRIWDHAGQPTGTAEADWQVAEQLIALQNAAGPPDHSPARQR